MERADLVYSLVFGFSAGLAVWALIDMVRETVSQVPIDRDAETITRSPFFKMILPFVQVVAYFVSRIPNEEVDETLGVYAEKKKGLRARFRRRLTQMRKSLKGDLIAAGKSEVFTPDEMIGTMVVSSAIFGGVGVYVLVMMQVAYYWVGLLVLFGFLFPVISLRDQVRRRQKAIVRAMPYSLDLLSLSMDAGLDFTTALARIVERMRGTPLGQEFGEMLRQIRMGKKRREALRDLADRTRLDDMTSFANSLIQADELGAPIGPVLMVQGEQMRGKRFQLAEKKAGEAPVKILFPLVAFIIPTVFIIMFGGMAIKMLGWA